MEKEKIQPWEQWEGEDERAYAAFRLFRDQRTPRSYRRVFGYAHADLCRWYSQFQWPKRCRAWDRHLERIELHTREELQRQTAKEVWAEHIEMLQSLRNVSQREIDKLLATSMEGDGQIMRPADLIKMIETAVKLDRLIRGETTDNPGPGPDLSNLSVDELRQFRALRAKMEKKEPDGT